MNEAVKTTNIQHLTFQRNSSLALSFLLTLSLIFVSVLLYTKSEKVVMIPYGSDQRLWLEKGSASNHYLERQGEIVANLLLNKTQSNAAKKREYLLNYTDASFYGALKKSLLKEEKIMKDQGIGLLFLPQEFSADENQMTASVTGNRISYLGEKKVSTKREQYTFRFRSNGKNLLLTGVEREEL